jgi:hypothetical protein
MRVNKRVIFRSTQKIQKTGGLVSLLDVAMDAGHSLIEPTDLGI